MGRKLFDSSYPVISLFLVVAWSLTGNWAATAIWNIFEENNGSSLHADTIIISVCLTILFIGLSFLLYKRRGDLLAYRVIHQHDSVTPHKGLILFVSKAATPVKKGNEFEIAYKERVVTLDGIDLENDIDLLEREKESHSFIWPWQQMMRGLKEHQSKVEIIILIGSKGASGTHKKLSDAKALVTQYVKNKDGVFGYDEILADNERKTFDGIHFEDLRNLNAALKNSIRYMRSKGLHDDEIIIDVTGGMKPASIAGAAVTLNNRVSFQYVQTEPEIYAVTLEKKYNVRMYDVATEQKPD